MNLEDYTIDELRAELKRRAQQKIEDDKLKPRCRNCIHFVPHPHCLNFYLCSARSWGKEYKRNYCVKRSTKACELFKNKYE